MKQFRMFMHWGLVALVIFVSSCDKKDLEIQQNYPFEVTVLPVPGEIAPGQQVELRCAIRSTGSFQESEYRIRYFQFEGSGSLQLAGNAPFKPNDQYPLPGNEFRLYYISRSSVSQSFDIWVADQFGNERHLSFQFNTAKDDENGIPVMPGPSQPTGPSVDR